MFLLAHVDPKQAKGKVAEAYALFPPPFAVPIPMQIASVSPELANVQSRILKYYMAHPKLDFAMMGMVNYILSWEIDYKIGIKIHSDLLKHVGNMTEKALQDLRSDPESAPLQPYQKAMLLFVLKAFRTPEEITRKDVDILREHGWEDKYIYEAVNSAVGIIGSRALYTAFYK